MIISIIHLVLDNSFSCVIVEKDCKEAIMLISALGIKAHPLDDLLRELLESQFMVAYASHVCLENII